MNPTPAIVHVAIVVALSGSITGGQQRALEREAGEIWSVYGVRLTWLNAGGDCSFDVPWSSPFDRILRVVTGDEDPRTASLGSVQFTAGIPEQTIRLRTAPASRLVLNSTVGNWHVWLLPPLLRDHLVGLALGRVLAHEIGHVLLEEPSHAGHGLMRASFSADDLTLRGHAHLGLPPEWVARLNARPRETVSP